VTLHHSIFDACQVIVNRPRTFERMRESMTRRVHARTDSGGRHFEHLLLTAT
jgi:hypothetical protein